MNYEQRVVDLVKSDKYRMRALCAVKTLHLPDWLIAAGFVRDLVWGSVFNKMVEINDIDVIYFCQADVSKQRDASLERQLYELEPAFPWSVKNQARMHVRHGDQPYVSTLDAMRFWPEKQTSIGVALNDEDVVTVRHGFDLGLQFSGCIDHNPARSVEVFNSRVAHKGWLKMWPALQVKI